MLKALRQSQSLFSRYYLNEEFNEVMFNFELRDDIVIGQPFRYFFVCFLAPFIRCFECSLSYTHEMRPVTVSCC